MIDLVIITSKEIRERVVKLNNQHTEALEKNKNRKNKTDNLSEDVRELKRHIEDLKQTKSILIENNKNQVNDDVIAKYTKMIEDAENKVGNFEKSIKEFYTDNASFEILREKMEIANQYFDDLAKTVQSIQKKTQDYFFIGFMFLLSSFFTIYQLRNTGIFTSVIDGIDISLKLYIFISLCILLEAYIIFSEAPKISERFLEIPDFDQEESKGKNSGSIDRKGKEKEISKINILKFPNILELLFIVSVCITLFSPATVLYLLADEKLVIFAVSINCFIISYVLLVIASLTSYIYRLFQSSVTDPKERISIFIAIIGTIITAVALFK